MAKIISNLGTVPSLTIGGVVMTDLTTLITLVAAQNQASNVNTTFRIPFGTAGYQVTTGKTLKIWALSAMSASSLISELYYSDNDVGVVSATSLTNPKPLNSYTAGSDITAASTAIMERAVFANIPALKYFTAVAASGTGTIMGYGYET